MPNIRLPPISVGPRDPGNLPNILGKLEAARVAIKKAPKENQSGLQAVFDSLEEGFRVLQSFMRMVWYMRGSTPAKHGDTHTPYSGIDPLPISTPLGLANSNIKGTVNAFLGGGAQFKRDVRVKSASVDVGTRNALNFVSGATVADNPGSDQVDITVGGSPLEVSVFLGHPPRIPKTQAGTNVTIVENALGPVISASGGSADSDQFVLASRIFGYSR